MLRTFALTDSFILPVQYPGSVKKKKKNKKEQNAAIGTLYACKKGHCTVLSTLHGLGSPLRIYMLEWIHGSEGRRTGEVQM